MRHAAWRAASAEAGRLTVKRCYSAGMAPRLTPSDVRNYYERNTRLFVRFGSQTDAASIHRALWAPGVSTLGQALNHAHGLVLAEIESLGPAPAGALAPTVLDLGCGIGGALSYLLRYAPGVRAFGLTLSPSQARHARGAGLAVVEADFQSPPFARCADLVFSIEAFIHAPDPARYFAAAASLLAPGGRVLIIDDTLADRAPRSHLLALFEEGWHTAPLNTLATIHAAAGAAGLRMTRMDDLTPLLRLRALPDRPARALLRAAQPLGARSAVIAATLGSIALQQLYQAGALRYRLMLFEAAHV